MKPHTSRPTTIEEVLMDYGYQAQRDGGNGYAPNPNRALATIEQLVLDARPGEKEISRAMYDGRTIGDGARNVADLYESNLKQLTGGKEDE